MALLDATIDAPDRSIRRSCVSDDARPVRNGTWADASDKAYFTDDEARDYEKHYLLDRAAAANIDIPIGLETGADLDTFEPGHVLPNRRTSLIVDPPDGKVPALTVISSRSMILRRLSAPGRPRW
jgi:hypothetical protein